MNKKRRLFLLLSMVKPLIPTMIIAIVFGVLGFISGSLLLIYPFELLLDLINGGVIGLSSFIILILLALFRGVFRYLEQLSNHYIAFKILELIRNDVFDHMRKLAPAKLENEDKGNLINLLTSDIEAIEVFYAHTISPILIAVITSIIFTIWLATYSLSLALIGIIAYLTIGALLPIYSYKKDAKIGHKARNKYGEFNSLVLDTIKGRKDLIQFEAVEGRSKFLTFKERKLYRLNRTLKKREGMTSAITDILLIAFTLISLVISIGKVDGFNLSILNFFIPSIILYNSFGPVLALSALSNNMFVTISSISRVLDILGEEPVVEDKLEGREFDFDNLELDRIYFDYGDEEVLKDVSFRLDKNDILSIEGRSGSGKSTLLKLLMNFWLVKSGSIKYNEIEINDIKTSSLRKNIAYVTQDTYIFEDTIFNNIGFVNKNSSKKDIIEACKMADIHDFISSLPNGYDTLIGRENSLSAGQRQRIGLARAFLHDSDLILLDEPTSNLDILSEGQILKVLSRLQDSKTIIIVSHRASTKSIASKTFKLERGIIS